VKATVTNKESGYTGTYQIVEIVGRLVCLLIDGRKVDFGRSEVQVVA